jgi:hypothetical protein
MDAITENRNFFETTTERGIILSCPISWEAFLDPSDSYFLFAEERRYHK